MSFNNLPTELQLNVLSQTHCPPHVSRDIDHLTQYVQSKKIAYYQEHHPILLSLYCSSSKDTHKKLFYETTLKEDGAMHLGPLHHKESLIKLNDSLLPVKGETYQNESHLDLVVNEEQTSSKIFITMVDSSNDKILLEQTGYISNTGITTLKHEDNIKFHFNLSKGEEEPPKEGTYDWDSRCNYQLQLQNIDISMEQLIELFEQNEEQCLIVRY